MITEQEKDVILRYAREYNAGSVFLFGSSIEPGRTANDIDLGVARVEPGLFFRFYADLVKHLPRPVDLVDMSEKSLFNDLVEETGLKVYDGPDQESRG
jgi:predicted nucleotidyltransferase